MIDINSEIPQVAQQGTPDEHLGKHVLQRNTTEEAIQVLVLSPHEAPQLQTIENRPDTLEALVGGPFITFPTGIPGTIGVASAEGAGLSPTPDRAINGTGIALSRTFVIVTSDTGDGITLQSLSPLQLERALERFAPTLPLAQFEQIVRSHLLGPEWIANWEPPEM
jgi:hypothetical protein